MRKFLSILMLVCLLCGLALPAGAEGEPAQLYVKVGGLCDTKLTVPEGFVKKTIKFYADEDCTTEVVPNTLDTEYVKLAEDPEDLGTYYIEAKKTLSDTISITADRYSAVALTISPSHLECSDMSTVLSGLQEGDEVTEAFQLVSGDELRPYTITAADIPEGGWMEIVGNKYYVRKAGEFQLGQYTGKVTVKVDRAPVAADDLNTSSKLNEKLASKTALETYLGYTITGPVTLKLPESVQYEGSIVIGEGMDGVTLTLQGNKNTFKKGLVVNGGNNTIDGITFTSEPAITLKNVDQCAVSNCKFGGTPFRIQTDKDGKAPLLILTDNTFTASNDFAVVLGADGETVVGTWQATPKADNAALRLGVDVYDYIPEKSSEVQAKEFFVDYSVDDAITDGWKFTFTFPCSFKEAYAVYNDGFGGKKGEGELTGTGEKKSYKMTVSGGGRYAAVSGSYPQLQDGKVIIREVDAAFLREVTVDTTYTNAVVKLGTKQVPSSINNKKLTFQLDKAGTYAVTATTAATTKSTTKTTTTTSRSYNYKYQDYYLITPQRVTDCMRYAKDNLVTIECREAGRRSISLPVASMAAAAEKGYSILLKNEKIADITLDAAALKSLAQQAKGTTVLLHYRSLNHKTLTTVGLASVQSHLDQFPNDNADLAFLVTATSDSETIEDLQLGTITLRIPFIVLPGTEEMKNEVYALQTETAASARETTVADGHLTTKLTDLTEHMVFQIGEPVETTEETTEPTVETTVETTQPETVPETTAAPEPVEEEKGFPIWIPIVAVLLLGGGAAAWFLYLRKRFQK